MLIEEWLTGYNPAYLAVKKWLWVPAAISVAVAGRGIHTVHTTYGTFRTESKYTLVHFFPWYERPVKTIVRYTLNKGLFVDVGANVGLYTIMAAKQGSRVVSIEPGGRAFTILRQNIMLNRVGNLVDAVKMAAWSEDAVLKLTPNKNSEMRTIGDEGEEVMGVPLDDVLCGLEPVGMKVDVEDAEPHVFAGLQKTLARCHPWIAFEAHTPAQLSASMSWLAHLGYKVRRLDPYNWYASVS